MNTAAKRTIAAAAAVAAAGLFGSLADQGVPQAQHGVPTVHQDVALVDVSDTFLLDEGTLDTALYNDVLGPTGAEEQLFSAFATATSTSEATTLLDATGANPVFSGDFNGAESRFFEAGFLDTLAAEDHLNQLLGVTETASQTAILADFLTTGGPPIPTGADVTVAELTAAVGTSSFDTDLSSIASADFTSGVADFEGYLSSLAGDAGNLGDLSTVLTDLSSSFSDLSNLAPDVTTVLGDLGLGGLLGSL